MLTNVVHLEFRKQRKLVANAMELIALCLAVITVEGLLRRRDLPEVISGVTAILLISGVPLLALLFGASAGSNLRSQPSRSAEEVLPFSPVRKVFGSYLASLTYFLLAASAVLMIALAFDSLNVVDQFDLPVSLPLGFAAVLQVHFLTFAFSYWLKQPILAGGLALVITSIEFYLGLEFYALTRTFYWDYYSSEGLERQVLQSVLAVIAVGSALRIISVAVLARHVEFEQRLMYAKGALVFFGLTIGVGLLYGCMHMMESDMRTQLRPAWYNAWYQSILDPTVFVDSTLSRGSIWQTASGSLVRVDENGYRKVLYRAAEVSVSQQTSPVESHFFIDRNGFCWLLTNPDPERNPHIYEIWKGDPGSELRPITSFRSDQVKPKSIVWLHNQPYLYGSTIDYQTASAPLPEKGKPPQWKFLQNSEGSLVYGTLEQRLAILAEEGLAARLIGERKFLVQKRITGADKTWTLPGRGVPVYYKEMNYVVPVFHTNEGTAFVLPVIQEGNNACMVVCLPDGSVSIAWTFQMQLDSKPYLRMRPIPGGGVAWTLWNKQDKAKTLMILGPKGEIYPALNLRRLLGETSYYQLDPRRLDGSTLRLIVDDEFLGVNLNTGTILNRSGLRTSQTNSGLIIHPLPTQEGVYLLDHRRIYLLTWDGNRRDLGPAKLR